MPDDSLHHLPARLDVLCAADLCVDVILQGNVRPRFGQAEQLINHYNIELGGSATIFAGQFARLGGSAGILGVIGQDLFGQFVQQQLARLHLDLSRVRIDPNATTGAGFTLAENNDRAILTYSGTIDALDPSDLTDEHCTACRHWHIASYFLLNRLRSHWTGWMSRLKKAGITTSLDPNWSTDGNWSSVRELLPLIDVFFANENEAAAIAGCSDPNAAGHLLARSGPLVVIKQGDRGSTAFQNGHTYHAAVGDITSLRIVDTIGAGDCFDAGFLRAWKLGRPISDCLDLATRCARASLGAPGGFRGQLREEIS
jgi:sugar/nucleoside kinase (ribokinase family)